MNKSNMNTIPAEINDPILRKMFAHMRLEYIGTAHFPELSEFRWIACLKAKKLIKNLSAPEYTDTFTWLTR